MTTWLWVHARSNTRSARRRSWYFSTRARQTSRVSPMPDTISIVADSFRIECDPTPDRDNRIEHGALAARECRSIARPLSGTEPLIACGSAAVRPRPMNRMRSVS